MQLTTTFRLLSDVEDCDGARHRLEEVLGSEEVYGQDTPITLVRILEECGLEGALDAIPACTPNAEARSFGRLLACDYAEHVLPIAWDSRYPNDRRPWDACRASREYASGILSHAELEAAERAAWNARDDCIHNSAVRARNTGIGAVVAACAATGRTTQTAQAAITAVSMVAVAAARTKLATALRTAADRLERGYFAFLGRVSAPDEAVGAATNLAATEEAAWQEARLRELLEAPSPA